MTHDEKSFFGAIEDLLNLVGMQGIALTVTCAAFVQALECPGGSHAEG